jgi:hypothetical protein
MFWWLTTQVAIEPSALSKAAAEHTIKKRQEDIVVFTELIVQALLFDEHLHRLLEVEVA